MAECVDFKLLLADYLLLFPEEKPRLKRLNKQLTTGGSPFSRTNFEGHLTGSAIVLSPDKRQVLLIFHKFLNVWQQPGGHFETGDANLRQTAIREAVEETGVEIGDVVPISSKQPDIPLDIDVHHLPARPQKGEPDHWHYDVRYAFLAAEERLRHQEEEVSAARWFSVTAPETLRISPVLAKLKQYGLL